MVPKLTNNGVALLIRAVNGEGITFSKIAIGSGEMPADFTRLTKLQNELVSMEIDEFITEDQHVIIKSTMSNANFEDGFYWSELGVYAQNPDGGDDILYAYAHYAITGDEAPTYIPASNSNLVEITHSVHVFVGELENVTAMLTKHSEFASAADFKDHVDSTVNPHNVTKEQVGLGLLDNVLPEDQAPVFSTAASAYSINEKTGKYTFSNIFSGEKLGNILQKVRTIIALVISHMNASNPHKVTAKETGAAAESHQHSARDINTGVLDIARGGTGGGTAAEARFQLGIQTGEFTAKIAAGEITLFSCNFPKAFVKNRVAYVVITPITADGKSVEFGIQARSRSGFTACLYSETYSGEVRFNWIACQ